MTGETAPDVGAEEPPVRDETSGLRQGGVPRRRFVGLAGGALALGLAGCLGRNPGRGTTTSALGDVQVTTTAGDDVEVLHVQMAISDGAYGPRVSYRLRNLGADDATVALRTVLHVEGGGTYEATAHVDVPAGDEMTVGYRVATWNELGEADAETVRRRDADFDVYVNGERRRASV